MNNESLKNCLHEYFCTLQNESRKLALKVNKNFKASEIHDFRVVIKKINAFKSLVLHLYPEFGQDDFFKSIYRIAGKLRGYVLLKRELKEMRLYNAEQKKFFKIKTKKYKAAFSDKYFDFKKEYKREFEITGRAVKNVLEQLTGVDELINEYLKKLPGKIRNFRISTKNEKSTLHDLRKLMKELGYNYSLSYNCLRKNTNKKFTGEINSFNKNLGKWHDKIAFKKFILSHKLVENPEHLSEQIQIEIAKFEEEISRKLILFNKIYGTIF